jgi:hypothetical protein
MITAAAPAFRMFGHPLPAMLASVAPRLRQATVTCSYADQVTIYNCRIRTSMPLFHQHVP